MSGLVGANPEQLDELAVRLDGGADTLEGIRHTIGLSLGRVGWAGQDGDQFRHEWDHRHARVIATAAIALREAARVARANADQQRAASGADASPGTGGLGGGSRGAHHGPGVGPPSGRAQWDVNPFELPQDLLAGFGHLLFLDDLLKFPDADLFKAGPLDVLGTTLNVADMIVEAARGELQLSTVAGVAWGVVTAVNPYARALDLGIYIGTGLADVLDGLGMQQGIINHVVQEKYGGELAPSEAADLTKRYEGIDGYVAIAGDAISAGWHKVKGLFG